MWGRIRCIRPEHFSKRLSMVVVGEGLGFLWAVKC